MKGLPLLIPVLFMAFISVGLAEPKTIVVGLAFSAAIVLGIHRGTRIEWKDDGLPIEKKYAVWAFWGALAVIGLQLLILRDVPLLHPAIRTQLNPRLTALTYFLGVPSSVYLFLKGRRYSLLYPLAVALYAYRTPVLVSILAIGAAYYEELRSEGRLRITHVALVGGALIVLGLGMTLMRGEAVSSLWTRVQSSTSVLDVIVWRGDWAGTYRSERAHG
jgi:uncharacterized membrane protein